MITPNPIVVPLTISINAEQVNFEVGYDIRPGGGGGLPYYEGAYEVTPTASEQTLETYHTIMRDNVTVHEIPYSEVSNPSGGYTVVIGG